MADLAEGRLRLDRLRRNGGGLDFLPLPAAPSFLARQESLTTTILRYAAAHLKRQQARYYDKPETTWPDIYDGFRQSLGWICMMRRPSLDPPVNDEAPTDGVLTGYDEQHLVTYLRLLDAAAENADWHEVARIVLHIDPERNPDRARRAWETHLARAEWMTKSGYAHLLRGGAPH